MAKKQSLFSNNTTYVSRYYSSRGRKLQKKRSQIADNFATSGARSQSRYKAIMETMTPAERDTVREKYSMASDEFFEIADIVQKDGLFFKQAEEVYNERIANEVDKLLNDL